MEMQSTSASNQNDYATLKSAIKTASARGIIKLEFRGKNCKRYIVLGSYEMEKWNRKRKKAFESGSTKDLLWEVIDYLPNTRCALVVCRNVVAYKKYNYKLTSVTWEDCSLREWLNSEFYETAFNASEMELIAETEISNPDNDRYHTPGGNDTKDRIFLLSLEEAQICFKGKEERMRRNCDGAGEYWWLRSPGYLDRNAAFVNAYGGINFGGTGVEGDGYDDYIDDFYSTIGVCPAFWLKLDP